MEMRARVAWYRDRSRLLGMAKLAMAAPLTDQVPAVLFQHLDHLPYFRRGHGLYLTPWERDLKSQNPGPRHTGFGMLG